MRRHAGVIRAIGRDGVITVHDGADGAEESDIFPFGALGVAATGVTLVMESGDIDGNRRDTVGLFKNLHTARDVALHESEFLVGKLARLVYDVVRYFHFSNVVQQGADAEQVQFFVAEIQMATEGERQHANPQTVQRRVFVLVLELV